MRRVSWSISGLTAVEVLVTITLLGILIAVVGTSGLRQGSKSAELAASTRELVSDLRLLRTKAIAENQRYGIDFSGLNKYDLCLVDISTTPDTYISFETVYLPRGITLSGNIDRFHFAPNGNIFGTPTIKINSDGEEKCRVKVTQLGTIQLDN